MKRLTFIILCLLMSLAGNSLPASTANRQAVATVEGIHVTTVASASDQDGAQTSAKLTWEEKAKDSKKRTGMRWWSLFGLLMTGGLGALLWKESEKRDTRTSLMVRYGVALAVFADCLLFFNILRWLFPGMIVIVIATAMVYLNRSRKMMTFLSVLLGVLLTGLCMSYDELMWEWPLVGGTICWLLNMFLFIAVAYIDITRICPHCNYFGDHRRTDTTFDGQDISTESYSSTQLGDKHTVRTPLGDYKARSTTTTTQSYTYLNKYYTDTYECMRCGKTFTYKRTESEEIDEDYNTKRGSKMEIFG